MFTRLILAASILCAAAHAQTAKVIQLSPEDAAQAKLLHEQKDEIEKKLADLEDRIDKHYLLVSEPKDRAVYCLSVPIHKEGWCGGFEYDSTFHFIVPKATSQSYSWPSGCAGTWYGATIVPAGAATFATRPANPVGVSIPNQGNNILDNSEQKA